MYVPVACHCARQIQRQSTVPWSCTTLSVAQALAYVRLPMRTAKNRFWGQQRHKIPNVNCETRTFESRKQTQKTTRGKGSRIRLPPTPVVSQDTTCGKNAEVQLMFLHTCSTCTTVWSTLHVATWAASTAPTQRHLNSNL